MTQTEKRQKAREILDYHLGLSSYWTEVSGMMDDVRDEQEVEEIQAILDGYVEAIRKRYNL